MEKVGKFIDKKSFLFKLLTDIEQHHKNNTHNTIPNLLFCGSSIENIYAIIRIICNMFINTADYFTEIRESKHFNILLVDCIFNSSIIDIRNNVQQFIKSKFIKYQGHKIIIFNNLDELTDEAQCALRVLMEENSTNFFIGVATHTNNIVSPILSRMMSVYIDNHSIKMTAKGRKKGNSTNTTSTTSSIYNKMKYDTVLHWLYASKKTNIENTIKYFNRIKREIIKIQNKHTIDTFFCELETRLYETYSAQLQKCTYIQDVKRHDITTHEGRKTTNYTTDLETYVTTMLVNYICMMKKYELYGDL